MWCNGRYVEESSEAIDTYDHYIYITEVKPLRSIMYI
jgi:hypothetical protein